MEQSPLRIGLVEDQQAFREQVGHAVAALPQPVTLLTWNSAEEFLSDSAGHGLDLLFVDVHLPHMNGLELVERVNTREPECRMVVMTALSSEDTIFRALKQGAIGYVLKSEMDNLSELIEILLAGGAVMTPTIALRVVRSFQAPGEVDESASSLTARERQVLDQIVAGLSSKRAADRLGVSENTVNTHVRSIYRKLNVRNRVDLVNRARDIGLM